MTDTFIWRSDHGYRQKDKKPFPQSLVLQSSSPITTTSNGQLISGKVIHATGTTAAITIADHQSVTIQNCKLYHQTGYGIYAGGNFDNLLIQDCWIVCEGAPAAGANPNQNMNNINLDGSGRTGIIVRRVRLEKGSSGIYALGCTGIQCQFIEGYDFRGPYPRGQVVMFNGCVNPLLEDFSVDNIGNTSWTEDCVNSYYSPTPTIRRGFINGCNSPSGDGIIIEGSGGNISDLDVVYWTNAGFGAGTETSNVTYTNCRARDGIAPLATSTSDGLTDYKGSVIPTMEAWEGALYSTRGPTLSGQEAFMAFGVSATIHFVNCSYWNLPRSPNLAWDQTLMATKEFNQVNFTPRAPIRNTFAWTEPTLFLQSSSPITTSANSQTIEGKVIHATGTTPAITVNGHQNVTIRNCKLYHQTGYGIRGTGNFSNLTIEDCWIVCEGAPAAGENANENMNNINLDGSGSSPTGVVVNRVRLEKGSSGIYALLCSGIQCKFIEGYDFRGAFPRGQLVQFNQCSSPLLEDFSCENIGNQSWTEDNINCYVTPNATIRRGIIIGNNSNSGMGVLLEQGSTGGNVSDVDVIFWGNGAFATQSTSSGCTFTNCRARDGIGPSATSTSAGSTAYDGSIIPTLQAYEGSQYTGSGRGVPLSGQEAFESYGTNTPYTNFVNCSYWNLPKSPNLAWNQSEMGTKQFNQVNFTPRAPIRNIYSWSEP